MDTTKKDFEWATHFNYLVLNAIGIWPHIHKTINNKRFADVRFALSVVLVTFLVFIPSIHSLMRIWGDMMSMIENLQFTFPTIISMLKLVIIWWKKNDLMHVLNMIAEDWIKPKSYKDMGVMIKQAQNARILTIFGYSITLFGLSLVIIPCYFGKPLIYMINNTTSDKLLPIPSDYLIVQDQSAFFDLIFVAQSITLFICATAYIGVDNLFGLLMFHLCGQMENLKGKLIYMNKTFGIFHRGLVHIVRIHIRLIKCFAIIESIFTLLLLESIVYFSIVFCVYGILIIKICTEGSQIPISRFIYLVGVVINIIVHMCLFCAVGEYLVTQYEGLYHSVYEYNWYKLEPKEARSLILLMIRTNKPLYITAGKLFPMTMSTFCNVIKTSAGYISVLLASQR